LIVLIIFNFNWEILTVGNGYVRSEAVVTVFLQKASVAKRNYATIKGALINTDGFKDQGITFPSGKMQNKLIQEVYAKCGVHPSEVSYVEAHGTGTKVRLVFNNS
jgi:fatty acid synthase